MNNVILQNKVSFSVTQKLVCSFALVEFLPQDWTKLNNSISFMGHYEFYGSFLISAFCFLFNQEGHIEILN